MPKLMHTAEEFIPARPTLNSLRKRAAECTACDLYKRGTQTVFGEGSEHAKVILVGEQPGDKEDLMGRPFVGPAGNILNKALEIAGIERGETYVTNIVKHFKWEPRGKKRIHKKPNTLQIAACRPWFDAEVQVIKPQVVICLGATAAQAILGRKFKVTKNRGELIFDSAIAVAVMATVHPSSILRAPDDESRREAMASFVDDLKVASKYIHQHVVSKAA
jgi:DNA polymerase